MAEVVVANFVILLPGWYTISKPNQDSWWILSSLHLTVLLVWLANLAIGTAIATGLLFDAATETEDREADIAKRERYVAIREYHAYKTEQEQKGVT